MPEFLDRKPFDRRRFLTWLGIAGIAGAKADALLAQAEAQGAIDASTLAAAEKISGLSFTDEERALMLDGVGQLLEQYQALRTVEIDNSVPPALTFAPAPHGGTAAPSSAAPTRPMRRSRPELRRPAGSLEELAFLPVSHLSHLIESRQVRSVELTRMYLDRLARHDETLHCVVTLTEETALEQAERADAEIAAGRYRGPLHGIPYGAKDLLAVPGYPTTWGAAPFRNRRRGETATVVRKLEDAGAVLIAKLALGALAWGDVWFGGKTRNPWNPEQGSSGSSAGSASATAAGLVGFAIGSETWGSIVSPCTRCGATGLRPTFGAVSRYGAMALSWSMDKLGPICRSVEDCALVYDAIRGVDGLDPSVVETSFRWDVRRDPRTLRVGWAPALFDGAVDDEDEPEARQRAERQRALDLAALDVVRSLGVELVPIELPDFPVRALSFILSAEAATAFDDLTRSNRDDELVRQIANAWPNTFRQARTIPAVEYLRANRARVLLMRKLDDALRGLDAYITPSFGGDNLLMTNLTGHPAVVLPHGFVTEGSPASITFMGNLYAEAEVLTLAHAYQQATSFHLERPPAYR